MSAQDLSHRAVNPLPDLSPDRVQAPALARPYRGAAWMIVALMGFTGMAVAGRILAPRFDSFEIMLARSVFSGLIVLAVALGRGQRAALAPRHMGLHGARSALHFLGTNAWLMALAMIPMAQLFAVEFLYPVLVALAAPLLLGERFLPAKIVSALVAFGGILVVARPWESGGLSPGLLIAFVAALGFAGAAILTKWLVDRADTLAILWWVSVLQMGMALAFALADGQITWPLGREWLWLASTGVAGLAAHWGMATAFRLAPASVVLPMDFLRLPLIAVVAALAFAEPFDPMVLLGGAIIVAANLANLRLDRQS